MNPLIFLLLMIIELYEWALIGWVIISVLVSFGILNSYQKLVFVAYSSLSSIVNPALQYIRRYVPPFGTLDAAPIMLFILLKFIKYTLYHYFG